MITVKWIEPNRVTDLEFEDWSEFVDWVDTLEQAKKSIEEEIERGGVA